MRSAVWSNLMKVSFLRKFLTMRRINLSNEVRGDITTTNPLFSGELAALCLIEFEVDVCDLNRLEFLYLPTHAYIITGKIADGDNTPDAVDIEQQIQKSEFLAILIQAMKSIGESGMTDHHRTVINGLLQKNLPIDTFEQDFKVAPHMGKENYLEHRKGDWTMTKWIEFVMFFA